MMANSSATGDLRTGTKPFHLTRTAEQLKISRHALRYACKRLNINGGSGKRG